MRSVNFLGIAILFCFTSLENGCTSACSMPTDYKKIDTENMFHHIFNFPNQLAHAMDIGQHSHYAGNYNNINAIVCVGMGGSGMAGDAVHLLCNTMLSVPFFVVKNYTLPSWCNNNTLVILVSYSGNTEETLSCLRDALAKKSKIIGITSGGTLQQELITHNHDVICIPSGLPPRAALGYLSVPILYFLYQCNVMPLDPTPALLNTINLLKKEQKLFCQAHMNNPAYTLAQQLYKKKLFIYGEATSTACIAERWRAQLAENSKIIASSHTLPELNHNEIVGWQDNRIIGSNVGVIWLLDDIMHPRNKLRHSLSKKIIQSQGACQSDIASKGTTFIERMFYLIHLGDWLSFWLAIMNNVNPTPVDNITSLKETMNKIA